MPIDTVFQKLIADYNEAAMDWNKEKHQFDSVTQANAAALQAGLLNETTQKMFLDTADRMADVGSKILLFQRQLFAVARAGGISLTWDNGEPVLEPSSQEMSAEDILDIVCFPLMKGEGETIKLLPYLHASTAS